MIDALQPLVDQPGVDLVMLATDDGVPIACLGREASGDSSEGDHSMGRDDALAALAVGWSNELKLATAPLTWDEPSRIIMRCSRGSIVMKKTRGAILVLLLAKGVAPDYVRLPMDGAVARIERSLRNMGGGAVSPQGGEGVDAPPGPMPSERETEPHFENHTSTNISGRDQTSEA